MMRNRSLGLLFFLSLVSCGRGAERSAPTAVGIAPSASEIVRAVRSSYASSPRAGLVVDGGRYRLSTAPTLIRSSGQLEVSFGAHAHAPLHLAPALRRDASLDIEALDVADAEATVSDGALVYRDVTPGVHAVVSSDGARVEELRLLTRAVDRYVARYRLTLGGGLASARVTSSTVELLDAKGVVRLRTAPITAVDAQGIERALAVELVQTKNEAILTVTLDAHGLAFPVVVDPSWTSGTINPRVGAGVTTTQPAIARTTGNKFIVAGGGYNATDVTARADEYDADADTWTTRASMKAARGNSPMAATLAGGKVLVAGGADDTSVDTGFLSTAEVYDPGTDTWTLVGSMASRRAMGLAVTLTDGRVLVACGQNISSLSNAEIYDPVAKTWTATATVPSASGSFTATRGSSTLVALPSNKALLVGNTSAGADTELALFDGATNTWSSRKTLTSTSLNYGNLLPGGTKFVGIYGDSSAVYDLSSNTWGSVVPVPSIYPRAVVPLTSGTLIAPSNSTGSVMRYDVSAGVWLATATSSGVPGTAGFQLSGDRAIFFDENGGYVDVFTSLSNGTTCSSSSDCASGYCVDGVCCNTACTAQCMACNESGKTGQCVIVSGLPRGSRPACSGSLDCPGACGGTSAICSPAPASTTCGTTSCTGSSITDPGKCSGTDGTCGYPAPKPCPGNFRCADGTTCKTTCTSDLDCAAGFFCSSGSCSSTPPDTGVPEDASAPDTAVEDSGAMDTSAEETLPEPPDAPAPTTDSAPAISTGSTFALCKSAADCPSGHCVDGTCCDTACDKPCFSCTLPTSPGVCSPVPLGADPHGDCSGGGSCIGTCSGTGSCVTAFVGSQCAPSKCTGPSQGIGAAFCPGKGAKCPTLTAAPFDCMPYACAPAFGACLTTCSRTEHCAPGFVCDASSKTCITQPASEPDSGGCAFGARTGAGLATWSLAALTLGWMRRRRRR